MLSNGTTIVVDEKLGKVFLGNAQGTAEVSLNTVLLQMSGGNWSEAVALRQQLRGTLAAPDMVTSLRSESAGLFSGFSQSPEYVAQMMPPGGFGGSFYCSYYYVCRDQYIPGGGGGGGGGGFGFRFWDTPNPSNYRGADYYYWRRWRDEQCDNMNSAFQDSGLTVGLTVACGLAATGIGAVGCAAGAIAVIFQMNDAAEEAKQCYSKYPGRGNW